MLVLIRSPRLFQMNCDTNPLEAGLDYFIKLNKASLQDVLTSLTPDKF